MKLCFSALLYGSDMFCALLLLHLVAVDFASRNKRFFYTNKIIS